MIRGKDSSTPHYRTPPSEWALRTVLSASARLGLEILQEVDQPSDPSVGARATCGHDPGRFEFESQRMSVHGFKVGFFPIKLAHGSAAPARVVAFIPQGPSG